MRCATSFHLYSFFTRFRKSWSLLSHKHGLSIRKSMRISSCDGFPRSGVFASAASMLLCCAILKNKLKPIHFKHLLHQLMLRLWLKHVDDIRYYSALTQLTHLIVIPFARPFLRSYNSFKVIPNIDIQQTHLNTSNRYMQTQCASIELNLRWNTRRNRGKFVIIVDSGFFWCLFLIYK